jgi:hypothetical protein
MVYANFTPHSQKAPSECSSTTDRSWRQRSERPRPERRGSPVGLYLLMIGSRCINILVSSCGDLARILLFSALVFLLPLLCSRIRSCNNPDGQRWARASPLCGPAEVFTGPRIVRLCNWLGSWNNRSTDHCIDWALLQRLKDVCIFGPRFTSLTWQRTGLRDCGHLLIQDRVELVDRKDSRRDRAQLSLSPS